MAAPATSQAGLLSSHLTFDGIVDSIDDNSRAVIYDNNANNLLDIGDDIVGLIRFDGCDTNVYHLIDETDAEKLRIGLPVEPVWRETSERTGSFADILHFRPLYEEDA